jgi:hypothetical protein
MRLVAASLAVALLASSPAQAWLKAGPNVMPGVHGVLATPGAASFDVSGASAAYGFRKLIAAYAGQAIRLRRASDSTQQDIGFAGSDFDTASATTFCNATSCFVAKWYDQTGNLRDMVQATAANQPGFAFACTPGGGPCMRLTAGTQQLNTSANVTPAGSSVSFSTVTRRTAGTGACFILTETSLNNRFAFNNVSGSYFLAATGSMTAAQTEGSWHAAAGIINGASSYIAVDAASTSGTVTINGTAAAPQISGAASTTCDEVEALFWDNYPLAAGEASSLNAGQRAYWGF